MTHRPLLVLTAAALLAAGARADTPAEVLKLVDDLKSETFTTRDKAATELANRDLDLATIGELLRRRDLTPEQRIRISNMGRERFVRTPRGALGVQFALDTAVASIQATFEKFPASKVLKPGDVIVAIDGVQLVSRNAYERPNARPYIIAADPGESIKVTLKRDGQTLEVDCPLGRFNDLNNGANRWQGASVFQPGDLEEAWAVRMARMTGAAEPEPIATGLSAGDWSPRGRSLVEREVELRDSSMKGAPPAVAGGFPRPPRSPDELTGERFGDNQVRFRLDMRNAAEARALAQQRELLTNQMINLAREISQLRARAEDKSLTQAQRDAASKDADRKMEQLNEMSQRMILIPR